MFKNAFALLFCLTLASPAFAADYYVSAAGNDANSGTSSSAPWHTLARVNALTLHSGDRVLLRGGDSFGGGLSFNSPDAGSSTSPITITSYGTGRATIRASSGSGISVYNTAGYHISNLAIDGAGQAASGILFYNDLPGGVKLAYVHIDSVDVAGFGQDGIEIGAWNGASGFRDVRITSAAVHDNARTGVLTYAAQPNVHESVYIGYSRAYNNTGISSATTNTGSGIVLGGVNGGTIERSVAYGNGALCQSPGGPIGIWTYDSTAVVIQHNESYDNRTGGGADGGGFDLDQNVSSSVMEYNYSHGNDGAGYMLAQPLLNDLHHGNTVRYNISENDGRKNSYAAIEVWGRTLDAEIYNNTAFLSATASGTPRAIRIGNASISSNGVSGVYVRNNVFETTGGLPMVDVSAPALSAGTGIRFEDNDYYASGAAFSIVWGGTTYSSLAAWRATTEETLSGTATGLAADPMLSAPGSGGTVNDATKLESIQAYEPRNGSPLIDAGLDLASRFAIDTGSRDYYDIAVPQGGTADIGAGEWSAASGTTAAEVLLGAAGATKVAGAWRKTADSTAAGGYRLWHPDAGAPKLSTALASPVNYFELTFNAEAGHAYRLWIRGVAQNNSWTNDSVFVQFSGSVDASGQPIWRIGSTSSATVNLEDCSGCGLSGWGWQDDGWGAGVLGPLVYFAADGAETIRIQTREDGFSIDQIVLSPATYLNSAPGALKNDNTILTATASATTPSDVVIYATDVAAASIKGDWSFAADATAAAGTALHNPDRGAAKITTPLANPTSYFDVPFAAEAGVAYHIWVRLRAQSNSTANDSVYLQLSGAVAATGAPLYTIGTTAGGAIVLQDYTNAPISGWGWNDTGWAGVAAPVYFNSTGTHTLRIQQREDGVFIDQIVISRAKYLSSSPGATLNDSTIVPK